MSLIEIRLQRTTPFVKQALSTLQCNLLDMHVCIKVYIHVHVRMYTRNTVWLHVATCRLIQVSFLCILSRCPGSHSTQDSCTSHDPQVVASLRTLIYAHYEVFSLGGAHTSKRLQDYCTICSSYFGLGVPIALYIHVWHKRQSQLQAIFICLTLHAQPSLSKHAQNIKICFRYLMHQS